MLHGRKYHCISDLHLGVSLRSFRSEKLAQFVKLLLDEKAEEAQSVNNELKQSYPIFLTRDFEIAKKWVKDKARGTERYGLLASSEGKRLRAEGIWVPSDINHVGWFLNGKDNVDSSYYLEVAASEFKVQGLEVDYAILAWDADFRYTKEGFDYFKFRELEEEATIRNFRIVQTEGSRQVTRDTKHYNLQMIIAVGFKVNNERAVQFRKWTNGIVKDYTIKGWVMDDERLKNGGSVLTTEYFDRLLEQIREIRLSERRFYQKITDIYATALDYDRTAKTTKQFFAKVQNKMHYAVHGHTAAELIYERADADKPHMGLTTWATAPEGKIVKSDVSVAKNYLSEQEMRSLERIVSAYLDLAEDRAERHIPMTMEDWAKRLDLFLMADDREVLQDAGKITAEIAKAKAETEFEKYRVIQDRLFMSDFDKYMLELEENAKK